jgi:hypothetical protein
MSTPPPWFARLPLSSRSGRRMIALDNNAVSNYFFEVPASEVRFVFEEPSIQIQIGRQVIDEALNHPGLAAARRPQIWTALGELQTRGKLILSGVTHMTAHEQTVYRELQRLLQANLSQPDSRVVADAMVKRVPLLTIERRLRDGLERALRGPAVQTYLTRHGLPNTVAQILVG